MNSNRLVKIPEIPYTNMSNDVFPVLPADLDAVNL